MFPQGSAPHTHGASAAVVAVFSVRVDAVLRDKSNVEQRKRPETFILKAPVTELYLNQPQLEDDL